MENSNCATCFKPNSQLICGICQAHVCKKCAVFLEEGSFSFLAEIPKDLSHGTYCPSCFNDKVSPELESYNETMERARNVTVFDKNQGKETRLIKRKEQPIRVTNCPDKEEAQLRLAFLAVKANYNTIVDVDIYPQKHRSGSYQTTIWTGVATPVNSNRK